MDVSDIMLVGVEASIVLAGFAGIIATYQINDATRIRRTRRSRADTECHEYSLSQAARSIFCRHYLRTGSGELYVLPLASTATVADC